MASKKFYTKIDPDFKIQFDQVVNRSKSIVITSHVSPDDDAISSMLSLYSYLTKFLGVDTFSIQLIVTGKENPRWGYFENYEKIQYKEDLSDELEGVDLLIMLDGSGWYRFTNKEEGLKKFSGFTVCIDHHPNPETKHDLHLLETNFVSCAEIIYKVFLEDKKIDTRFAENVFLGIWGDTGGLRFVRPDNTSAFETIKKLIEIGNINIQTLESKYMKYDFGVFRIISALMERTTIEIIDGWPPAQVSYLPREVGGKYNYSEVSYAYHIYLSQYMRMVEGADWGFVVIPKDIERGVCGVSFRSLPDSVNVRLLAENLNGGGHDRAAGGEIPELDPEKAVQAVLSWMRKNKPVLK